MKCFIFTLLLSLSAAANNQLNSIDYLSWCVDNRVMQLDENGQVFERLNCGLTRQTCAEHQNPVGRSVVVYAVCK